MILNIHNFSHNHHHRQHHSLYSHYGSIVTIGAMGREAIRNILIPNLKQYESVLKKYSNDPVLSSVAARNHKAITVNVFYNFIYLFIEKKYKDILSKLKDDPIDANLR